MVTRIFSLLLTLVIAGGVIFSVRSCSSNNPSFMSDAQVRERMQAEVARDPSAAAFFSKFETLFPEEHARFLDQMVALYRGGATQEQAFNAGQRTMTTFIEANVAHAASADPETLTALARTLSAGVNALASENPTLCAQLIRTGVASSHAALSLSPSSRDAMMQITNHTLDAIAAGRSAPTQYVDPTDADMNQLVGVYTAQGGDVASLAAFGDPAQLAALDTNAVCRTGQSLWNAVLLMPGDFIPRFVSYSMRNG